MTEVKRYADYAGMVDLATSERCGGGTFIRAYDYDALLKRCEALEAQLVDFREKAAQVCNSLGWGNNKIVNPAAGTACANAIKNIPIPESAERVADVLRAAEKYISADGPDIGYADLVEAVRKWREAG